MEPPETAAGGTTGPAGPAEAGRHRLGAPSPPWQPAPDPHESADEAAPAAGPANPLDQAIPVEPPASAQQAFAAGPPEPVTPERTTALPNPAQQAEPSAPPVPPQPPMQQFPSGAQAEFAAPGPTTPQPAWPQPSASPPAAPAMPPAPPFHSAVFPPPAQAQPQPQGFPPGPFPGAPPIPPTAQYAAFQPNQPPNYAYPPPPYNVYGQPPGPIPPFAPVAPPKPPKPPKGPRSRRAVAIGTVTLLLAVLATAGGLDMARSANAADGGKPSQGQAATDIGRRALWRTVPAGDLLPATLKRDDGSTYSRVGIDPDEGCTTLPPAFTAALAPAKCSRDIQATYVDTTQTVTATVGIVVLAGTSTERSRMNQGWAPATNAVNYAMMPNTYAVPATIASGFGNAQRIAWGSNVSDDGTYLVYTVTGFTDGRPGPDAAAFDAQSESDLQQSSPPVQVAGDLPSAVQYVITVEEQKKDEGS